MASGVNEWQTCLEVRAIKHSCKILAVHSRNQIYIYIWKTCFHHLNSIKTEGFPLLHVFASSIKLEKAFTANPTCPTELSKCELLNNWLIWLINHHCPLNTATLFRLSFWWGVALVAGEGCIFGSFMKQLQQEESRPRLLTQPLAHSISIWQNDYITWVRSVRWCRLDGQDWLRSYKGILYNPQLQINLPFNTS